MRALRTAAAWAAILASLLWRCSFSGVAGGNSSDTGNVVAIAATSASITVTPRRDVKVDVFDVSYTPFKDSGYHAWKTADSGETAVFDIPASGFYNVLVRDTIAGTGLFALAIPALPDSAFAKEFDSLRALGGITGVAVNAAGDSALYWTFVYIAGSPFWDYTAGSGGFSLENIPPGRYEMTFYGLPPAQVVTHTIEYSNPQKIVDASDSVTVFPGQTVVWVR